MYKDRETQRAYHKRWYSENKQKTLEKNERWRNKRRNEHNEYKRNLGCAICEEKEPCVLDFHHLDNTSKDFNVSEKMFRYSRARLLEEMQKCIVLCSNCHRKFHAGIVQLG